MKMDYKLYLSIIFAIAICFVLFLGYAHWAPNLPTDKDILSNWITVLIFLVTASAGIMPFVLNDRQHKFEKEIQKEFEKLKQEIDNLKSAFSKEITNNINYTNNLYLGVSKIFRQLCQYEFNRYQDSKNNNNSGEYDKAIYNILICMTNELFCLLNSPDDTYIKNFNTHYHNILGQLQKDNSFQAGLNLFIKNYKNEEMFISRDILKNNFGDDNPVITETIKLLSFIYEKYDQKTS